MAVIVHLQHRHTPPPPPPCSSAYVQPGKKNLAVSPLCGCGRAACPGFDASKRKETLLSQPYARHLPLPQTVLWPSPGSCVPLPGAERGTTPVVSIGWPVGGFFPAAASLSNSNSNSSSIGGATGLQALCSSINAMHACRPPWPAFRMQMDAR